MQIKNIKITGIKIAATAGVVRPGLVAYLDALNYPGSGTNWPDDSGNGNDCTLASPDYNSGPPAYLNFTGSNYGLMGTVVSQTAYTKCAVIYVDAYASNNIISGRAGNYHAFWMGGTTGLRAGHNGDWYNATGATTLNLNQWYFVGVTFDTTNGFKLYLNDAVDGVGTNPAPFGGSDPGDCNVGAFEDGNNFYGRIPVAMVYNRALTDAEMLTNFNALRGRFGI
jgi:Concanavalin A-like lectin/glucanases superfamily